MNKSPTLAHGEQTLSTLFEAINMVQLTVKSPSTENAKGFVYSDHLDKERESKKRFCLNKFEEFCKRTDLHGYKYIVMEDYNIVERFVLCLIF